MASNILINFSADTGGLDEASRKLEELTKREKELVAEAERLKREQQGAQLNARNAQEQARATQEYGRRIQEVRTQLQQTRRSLADVTAEHRRLEQNVTRGGMQQSFRALKRELQEQMRQMQLNGQVGSEAYNRIRDQLIQLNVAQREANAQIQQMSSVSYGFDTVIKGTQLVAGGYSVMTGAIGLFGEKNQEVQLMMMKLQSTIAITTGLQSIYNTVVGEGNIITRISALQIRAKAIAESLATKNTILATIAQKAFNLVAMANPYVLLAIAIVSVVGALYIFSRNTETAAEKQKKLNDLQKEAIELKKEYAESLTTTSDLAIRKLERELELMKAKGASEAQLALKTKQINDERVRSANEIRILYGKEISDLEKNRTKVQEIEKALSDMNHAKQQAYSKVRITVNGESLIIKNKEIDKKKEELESMLAPLKLNIQLGQDASNADDETRHKAEIDAENDRKKAAEAGRKSAVALAEYKVLIAKKGSQEELNAQISAINAKKNADLFNVNLTNGERLKLIQEAEVKIKELKANYNKLQLEDEKAMIEAGMAIAIDGSLEKYNYQTQLLSKQREIELNQTNLTEAQKLLIQNNYLAKLTKLTDDYFNDLYKQQLETDVSVINEKLANVKAGSQEEYALRVELIEAKAKLEKDEIENTIKNEELKSAKIKEINAQLARDKKEILKEQDTTNLKNQYNKEVLLATQQYEKGKLSRRAYESELNKITIDSLNRDIEARRKNGEDTIDLEQELSEKRIEIAEQEAEAKQAMQEEFFNTISALASSSFDSQKARIQQELADLDYYYTTDAEKAKENTNLKLISQEEYNRRQLELKRKQAQVEKEQAIFNIMMTSGQAIARAFADYPFPFSAVIAGLVGVQALVQLNSVRSQPLPKYWKGRKGGKGEHALVGEYGPEIMWIPDGATIMPAHDSLRAINGDTSVLSKWDIPSINPSYPIVPSISQQLITDARVSHNTQIDYDKLGRAVAKYQKTPKERPVYVNVDRSGTTVTDGNTKTKYLNNTYKGIM